MIYICAAVYLLIMNLVSFCMMYADKQRAIRHKWRISEKTLFLSAIFGGSLGGILGMRIFRHKTRHWYFVWGLPFILAVQILILLVLWYAAEYGTELLATV
ncbi:MAG: DUF1294 domain-containing protein [Lachnospiraceae bacterium]|jgi:uncharacterized membrane protein YsdA (DUF1294 family)|nr:DUF1294 domain-containing protein [Lachnospiraceae bacterium]